MKPLNQKAIDWLIRQGVPPIAIITPAPVQVALGKIVKDGRFEHGDDGDTFLAFEEERDTVYWDVKSGRFGTEYGRAFALGEDLIWNPGATALGNWLNVFADPVLWLRENRYGIVVVDWSSAFEYLRDVQRIAIAEEVLHNYRKNMVPKLPELAVLPKSERRAA